MRAGGRGEAAWAHVGRHPQRWASGVPGSTCGSPPLFRVKVVRRRAGFKVFSYFFEGSRVFFVRRRAGSKVLWFTTL